MRDQANLALAGWAGLRDGQRAGTGNAGTRGVKRAGCGIPEGYHAAARMQAWQRRRWSGRLHPGRRAVGLRQVDGMAAELPTWRQRLRVRRAVGSNWGHR